MPATHHSSGRPRGRSIGLWSLIAIAITALAMFLVTLPRDAGAVTGGQTFTTPGNHQFVVPPGVFSINVEAWGGGGGGASGAALGSGGGGGGGGYSTASMPVEPGDILSIVVGAGGAGGTAVSVLGTDGVDGGQSQVSGPGTPVVAGGGGGGNVTLSALPGSGGVGGSGTTTGANGSNGTLLASGNGGGAGGAGGGPDGGAGGPGATCAAVAVLCVNTITEAQPGVAPGGGGGGGHAAELLSLDGIDGAAGARGEVRITWTAPNVNAAKSDVVAETPVEVGQLSNVTVTAADLNGVPIPGALVQVTRAGGEPGTSTINPNTPIYTDVNGDATFTISHSVAGTVAYQATITTGVGDDTTEAQLPFSIQFVDTGDPDLALSTITADPVAGVVANGIDSSTVTVSVVNSLGNPVSGASVQLATTGGAIASANPAVTNGGGLATFQVTSLTPGTFTYTATVTGGGVTNGAINDNAQVTFVARTVDTTKSTIEVIDPASPTPPNVNANGLATATVRVTVLDQDGQPWVGENVELEHTGASTVMSVIDGPNPRPTGLDGTVEFTVHSENPGIAVYRAIVGSTTITGVGNASTVNFVTPGADAGESTVTVHPSDAPHTSATVIANGVSYATVTVTVRDAQGQPVVGEEVILHMNPGAQAMIEGNAAGNSAAKPTDANGMVTFEVRSEFPAWNGAATLVNFTATAGSDLGTVGVMFTPQVPDLTHPGSTITAYPPTVLANGVDETKITVTLVDAAGVPLIGSGPDVTIEPTATLTSAATLEANDGVASGFTASSADPQVVQYVVTNIEGAAIGVFADLGMAEVTFTNQLADPVQSTVVVHPSDPPHDFASVIANDWSVATVTVTLRDASGELIEGLSTSLHVSSVVSGPLDAGDVTITPLGSTLSDVNGEVKFEVRSTTPGEVTLQAAANLPAINATVNVEFTPQEIDVVNIDSDTPIIANGVSHSVITVELLDAAGQPIPNYFIDLEQGAPGTSVFLDENLLPDPSADEGTTDADGIVRFRVRHDPITDPSVTITYTAEDGPDALATVDVTFLRQQGSAAESSVVADPDTVIANNYSYSVVTVTLRDEAGVPIANAPVELTGDGDNNVEPQSTGSDTTDADGVATFLVRSATDGTERFTASHLSIDVGFDDVLFTKQVADPTKSTVNADPNTVRANGVHYSTVTVTLYDADNVLVDVGPQPQVTLQALLPANDDTIDAPASKAAVGGVATFTVRSESVRTVTYRADVAGPSFTDTATVDFIQPSTDPAKSYLTADPVSVIANGVSYSTVTVHLRDADDQPLVGGGAILTGDGTATIEPLNGGASNNNGEARFRVRRTSPATVTFSAFTGPDPLPPISNTVDVEFTEQIVHPGPLNNGVTTSTVVANPTSVPANGESFSVVTVTVRDDDGVGIPGKTVTLAGDGQPETLIGPASGPTDANGQVTFEVRRTSVGAVLFTATVDGVTLGQQAGVTFTEPVVSSALSYLSANPQAVRADGVESAVITVTVVDTDGVPLEGVTDITLSQDGSSTISAVSGPTNAAGEATFTVTNTVIEQVTYSATVDGTPVANTTWVVFWNPDGAPPVVGGEGCTFPPVPAGQFLPALPPFGVAISIWGGGPISSLPQAISYWGTYNNQLINYIPGAPAFVNARFNAAYANGIPACLGFIVRR